MGLFITIEGTDGSGKGTQTKLLVEWLKEKNLPVQQISFPRYGERSATMVEDYLTGKFGASTEVGPYRASIFFAIDRYAASFTIKEWLNNDQIVIADRYVNSNMAHQGGSFKTAEERQKYFAWNYDLEYNIFGLPKPDINFILHVPAKIAQKLVDQKKAREYLNGKKRDILEDDLFHLQKAEQAYLHLTETFPEFKLLKCSDENKILSIETIHEIIVLEVKRLLEKFNFN